MNLTRLRLPAHLPVSPLAAWVGAAISFFFLVLLLGFLPAVARDGEVIRLAIEWIPALGIDLSFRIDGLSLLFGLVISFVGLLIFVYSSAYFRGDPEATRILIVLVAFMLAMLGLVLADHLIALFVFWELTTITSFILIGTRHEDALARRNALQAILVTAGGGLCLMAAIILLGEAAGSYQLSEIITRDLTDHPHYSAILTLVLLGCLTKSALFPFHFWLPNAMAAPTPISAYLHSATMVKAGLYLLARLHPSLAGTDLWFWSLAVTGGITAVWSSIQALKQRDLKLMLAYTTVMALGTIALFLAADSGKALMAALVFLLVHALYKAALFMVVGNLDKAAGSRDWSVLKGLRRFMPWTFAAAVLAALSMAGVPPFFGFIGKEILIAASLAVPAGTFWFTGAVVVSAALMAGVAFFLMTSPFFGDRATPPKKRLSAAMVVPPLLLAALGLIAGPFASFLPITPLLQSAALSLSREAPTIELTLWHGFGPVLYISIGILLAGAALARFFVPVHRVLYHSPGKLSLTADRVYDGILHGLLSLAEVLTLVLQNGRQRFYVMTIFSTLVGLIGLTALNRSFLPPALLGGIEGIPLYQWILCAFIALSVLLIVFSHSRMLAICALGTAGTGIALFFVIFSAPDVAMTQFMTEILVVIILTLVTLRLPVFHNYAPGFGAGRIRDAAIAIASGVCVSALMLSMVHEPVDLSVSDYYGANSYTEAKGRNIVNVILVDFRAMDTLGEIVVVAIAGLACHALIKLRRYSRGQRFDARNLP
ncbi:MAG: DUF4040 domain-containing protein [Alphaproteobacteria bacterium]|nr:DUF4040 domain-containing protein [Alphaproteobacteria bacterium]